MGRLGAALALLALVGLAAPPSVARLQVNQLTGFGAGGVISEPDTVATLWGWWRSDSMNKSGSSLTSWTDKSGNSRTFNPQGSDPDVVTGANGFDAADLDTASVSANERLISAGADANLTDYHVFAVLRPDTYAADSWGIYGENSSANSTQSPMRAVSGADRFEIISDDGGVKRQAWSAAAPSAGTWALVEVFQEDGVEIGINVDDGTAATTAVGSISVNGQLDALTLGAAADGSSGMDMSVTELIVYSSRLSSADRQTIIDYLTDRYGSPGTW